MRKIPISPCFMFLFFLLLVVSTDIPVNASPTPSGCNSKEETSLKLVAILHRHGFRTPERTWPKDPYANDKYWPIGWGQLYPRPACPLSSGERLLKQYCCISFKRLLRSVYVEKEGKRQLYRLGKTYRKRYANFITEYSPQSVRVNSSDLDRCHMSAASLLAGWFPPKGKQIWTDKLLWQPIPIHSVPSTEDRVLSLKAPCPRYYLEKGKVDQEIKANATSADKRLFKYLTKHMGENITSIAPIETYYSTLLIEDIVGYKLQKWTKKVYPRTMLKKYFQSMESYTWTDYLKKMFGGPLIKEIVNQFQTTIESSDKQKKLYLYSAHDSTIVHVWKALRFEQHLKPDFGASLIFELHNTNNLYHVKLFYMNNTRTKEPYQLSIPNCPDPCTFAKLQTATEYVRSVDWDKDCVIQ